MSVVEPSPAKNNSARLLIINLTSSMKKIVREKTTTEQLNKISANPIHTLALNYNHGDNSGFNLRRFAFKYSYRNTTATRTHAPTITPLHSSTH